MGSALKFLRLPLGFKAAFAPAATKHFLRIRPGERVARDILAALDAFQQKRIFRVVREAQMRAHRRQQIRRERS